MPDEDIARLLPEPPPPRASRREAAIGAALRRFDGDAAPMPLRPMAWQRPAWTRMSRTQIGAFASIALVAVVGLPLALNSLQERLPAPREPASAPAAVAGRMPESAVGRPAAIPSPAAPDAQAPVVTPRASAVGPSASPFPEPTPMSPPSAPPPQAFAVGADKPCAGSGCEPEIAVQGRRATAAKMMTSPSPISVVSGNAIAADESEGRDIIVTASRSTRPAAAYRRGDWNACTVNDPAESLAGCKALIDPSARGASGEAAARVADGLSLAWRGDLDGAIRAFDAAIALQPRLAIAYLNRGLAYQRQGERDRALADLDRAVRRAPYAARVYYARSLLLREKGDIDRARADEARAVDRDARYSAVVE